MTAEGGIKWSINFTVSYSTCQKNLPATCLVLQCYLLSAKVKKHREENLIAKLSVMLLDDRHPNLPFIDFHCFVPCCMPNRMDFSSALVNLQETLLFSQPSTPVCTYTDKLTAQTTNFISTRRLNHKNKTGKHPG